MCETRHGPLFHAIFGGSVGLKWGGLVFRSEVIASLLKQAYQKFPHDRSVLPDEQFEVRTNLIVILGCLVLSMSLIGLIKSL